MESNLQNTPDNINLKDTKIRYALLDELRGFLVLCMVFYHGFFTLDMFLDLNIGSLLFDFFTPVEPFFAGAFILLSGMMCGFSHSNIRRGALCSLVAVGVSVVTIIGANMGMGSIDIYFGILHLLGFSMLFCGIFNFALKRINKWVGLTVSAALYVIFHGVPNGYTDFVGIRNIIPAWWYGNEGLFPFGITTDNFHSADYFPLIPWIFIFFAGYYLYRFHIVEKYPKVFMPKRIPPLGFLGRHALVIYIVHQPIIYLLCLPFAS